MSLWSDLKVLYHLTLAPVRGKSHQDRLESFYGGQAQAYDSFRKRLLQGREQLYSSIKVPTGGCWVDVGGGTGSNLENLGESIKQLGSAYVVDLTPSLLKVADERIAARGWTNVKTLHADATTLTLPEGQQADVVTFSYSLTMIPDWFAAVDAAWRLLKPGGTIGVVDFYVGRKWPEANRVKHAWSTRHFWRTWFDADNVFPSPDHVSYLQHRFQTMSLDEARAKLPYMPFVRMPYYRFVGTKVELPLRSA
ncbi:MAG TPA: class I SAM-dependent methyltransferase [Gemmatales bacterium]|nr:class I SAM-dependent methyltransferase [Gemmatales bacterium]